MTIEEINNIYNNNKFYNIAVTDKWMDIFFNVVDIDINLLEFNFDTKYTEIKKNDNTFLFFRFEDFQYISDNILPKYGIIVKEKVNVGSEKYYASYYKKHKEIHEVLIDEENSIRESIYTNKFYSKYEIEKYLSKYKKQ
jgi:hypothetical protein